MTFPTKQEIEFFKEAKQIQEEWEPRAGDWVQDKTYVGPLSGADMRDRLVKLGKTWLPRLDQLIEMLEERGYRWDVGKLPDSYTATTWNDEVDDSVVECEGLTPSIALGKCLLEVLGDV